MRILDGIDYRCQKDYQIALHDAVVLIKVFAFIQI